MAEDRLPKTFEEMAKVLSLGGVKGKGVGGKFGVMASSMQVALGRLKKEGVVYRSDEGTWHLI